MTYVRLFTTTLLLSGLVLTAPARAQHSYRAALKDAHHDDALTGVNVAVEGTTIGAATGPDGHVTVTGTDREDVYQRAENAAKHIRL